MTTATIATTKSACTGTCLRKTTTSRRPSSRLWTVVVVVGTSFLWLSCLSSLHSPYGGGGGGVQAFSLSIINNNPEFRSHHQPSGHETQQQQQQQQQQSSVSGRTMWKENRRRTRRPSLSSSLSLSSLSLSLSTSDSAGVNRDDLGLTPELEKMTQAFAAIGDDKLRYKQLLYMAQHQLAPMEEQYKTPEYKVMGCLSNVYIHAKAVDNDNENDNDSNSNTNSNSNSNPTKIVYTGDSDGLLTKGLVALLVRGLSNCTVDQIQRVNPQFIQTAGIQNSLTPGRNNGFLNMLTQMKRQAVDVAAETAAQATTKPTTKPTTDEDTTETASAATRTSDRPLYDAMMQALEQLQPVQLELKDVSYQHAGHAEAGDGTGESHFELSIVTPAFEGIKLVKRHQMIYILLGDIMSQIHALQITTAQTPAEAGIPTTSSS